MQLVYNTYYPIMTNTVSSSVWPECHTKLTLTGSVLPRAYNLCTTCWHIGCFRFNNSCNIVLVSCCICVRSDRNVVFQVCTSEFMQTNKMILDNKMIYFKFCSLSMFISSFPMGFSGLSCLSEVHFSLTSQRKKRHKVLLF